MSWPRGPFVFIVVPSFFSVSGLAGRHRWPAVIGGRPAALGCASSHGGCSLLAALGRLLGGSSSTRAPSSCHGLSGAMPRGHSSVMLHLSQRDAGSQLHSHTARFSILRVELTIAVFSFWPPFGFSVSVIFNGSYCAFSFFRLASHFWLSIASQQCWLYLLVRSCC